MRSVVGTTSSSSRDWNGIGDRTEPTRTIGASRSSKRCSRRPRGDLGAPAAELDGLVDDRELAGPVERRGDGLGVHRPDVAHVDYLASIPSAARLSAASRQRCAIRPALTTVRSLARARDPRAESTRGLAVRRPPRLAEVEVLALEEDHRVVAARPPRASSSRRPTPCSASRPPSPGTWANIDSRLCECCGPWLVPAAAGIRITSGTLNCPLLMNRSFAPMLTI